MTIHRTFWLASAGLLPLACSNPEAPAGAAERGESVASAEKVVRPVLDIVPGLIQKRPHADGAALAAETDPSAETDPAAPATTARKVEPVPSVFFGIQTRDHQLWMHHGTEPSLFTVQSREGVVLAERIDADRLARDYPKLWEMYAGGVDLIGIGY